MWYNISITKENLDQFLRELAKEYRKINGKHTLAEVILVGGAAVLVNYGFREMTYDVDVVMHAASSMKEAIRHVSDKYGLPEEWLNTGFTRTDSFSSKVIQHSTYYKTFSNIVQFRTVSGIYLIAMKLMAGRQYKYDLSDVVGILCEHKKRGTPIGFEEIKEAVEEMYGAYDNLPVRSREFIENVFREEDYEALYRSVREQEAENKDILLKFQEDYPGAMNGNNINDIIMAARKKRESEGK